MGWTNKVVAFAPSGALRAFSCVLMPAVLATAGCATPYQSKGAAGGFSDFRITTDVFSVSFRGNTSTTEDTVEAFLLRRASELTLRHGFRHFVILREEGRTRSGSVGYSGVKVPVVAPALSIRIRCFADFPSDSDFVINAENFLLFNYPEMLEALQAELRDTSGDSGLQADE